MKKNGIRRSHKYVAQKQSKTTLSQKGQIIKTEAVATNDVYLESQASPKLIYKICTLTMEIKKWAGLKERSFDSFQEAT